MRQAPPHIQADDVEVGGSRGREALDRLRNVIGRVESSWRPASAEEGFEIVRRRLFEPLVDREQFVARDATARTFLTSIAPSNRNFRLNAARLNMKPEGCFPDSHPGSIPTGFIPTGLHWLNSNVLAGFCG